MARSKVGDGAGPSAPASAGEGAAADDARSAVAGVGPADTPRGAVAGVGPPAAAAPRGSVAGVGIAGMDSRRGSVAGVAPAMRERTAEGAAAVAGGLTLDGCAMEVGEPKAAPCIDGVDAQLLERASLAGASTMADMRRAAAAAAATVGVARKGPIWSRHSSSRPV